MVIEPRFLRTLPVCLLSIPRHGNQLDVLENWMLPDPFRDLIAVQARQADVQQHHVRSVIDGGLHCCQPVVSSPNIMPEPFHQHRGGENSSLSSTSSIRKDGQAGSAISVEVDGAPTSERAGVSTTGRRTTNSLPCPKAL